MKHVKCERGYISLGYTNLMSFLHHSGKDPLCKGQGPIKQGMLRTPHCSHSIQNPHFGSEKMLSHQVDAGYS
jgi:hypothetical protein